jgi:phosphohistidine swiveling domain-containing protein
MTYDFIYLFSQTTTLEAVGGKGLNLMRLTQAGMPVPPGFVVSTEAYAKFVTFNHLDNQLEIAFDALAAGRSLEEVSAQIRIAFEQGEFPVELTQQIATAYQQLGQVDLAVAVRSSATAEDLAEASFAGQQDTYLNVRGETDVLDAIRRCFGSLWSERAIDYHARQKRPPLSAQLAVVVQQMVFAEAAGVAFTADPVSGDSNLMVIDAVYGLGETLVSGVVTPDHLVLDKRSGVLLSYFVAEKNIQMISTPDGTQEQSVPRSRQKRRVLDAVRTRALYLLGQRIEAVYGRPQDLEWCLADGNLYVVQARPITTLPEILVTWQAPGEGQWLHGGGSFEMITEPISPLFETALFPIFYRAIKQMLSEIGLNGMLPAVPYRVVNGFIYLHMQIHLRPWHLFGVLRDFALHLDSMKVQESEQALYRTTVTRLIRSAINSLTNEQILARIQALGESGMRYWLQIMKIVQVIYRQEKSFRDFYQRIRCPSDPEPEIFLRGQKIKPWAAECSTFDLAQLARKLNLSQRLLADGDAVLTQPEPDSALREWVAALETHLEHYGHQLSSFDLSLPTLADDPRPVLAAIRAFLDGKESPYTRQEQMTGEREQATTAILSHLTLSEREKFTRLLETAQHAARTREDALFDVGQAWTQMHRCALELGRRLTSAGVLAQSADVFWLTVDEIHGAFATPASLKDRVTERQRHNRAWSKVNAPYLLPVGSRPAPWWHWIFPTPELQRHPDAHTLIGLGVSPGKITGVARVIHSLAEMEQINPGEILVTRTTTPAWTPLFARISGLITDLGGPLAHGSIVAREVGIPAVMGTGNATQKICSGQIVTILGSEGKVLVD